jgi:hypothetical protein
VTRGDVTTAAATAAADAVVAGRGDVFSSFTLIAAAAVRGANDGGRGELRPFTTTPLLATEVETSEALSATLSTFTAATVSAAVASAAPATAPAAAAAASVVAGVAAAVAAVGVAAGAGALDDACRIRP